MKYMIYPPIGIARLGNSDAFFIGPEWPGGLGVEVASDNAGTESDVEQFKDAQFRIKRQAARFRLFQFTDIEPSGRPVQLPEGAQVRWMVHLVNKKAAVDRGDFPPGTPTKPKLVNDRVLDGGKRSVQGANAKPVPLQVTTTLPNPHPNNLGELRTDGNQNLMVFGGRGGAEGTMGQDPITNFYNNPSWFDDISDGPVTAEILSKDGDILIAADQIAPAWVIVAPPDFAPTIQAIVTLYDVLFQVGLDKNELQMPQVSFTEHIYPLLRRVGDLHWVNDHPHDRNTYPNGAGPDYWNGVSQNGVGLNYKALSDPSSDRTIRKKIADLVRNAPLGEFRLREFQEKVLDLWVDGLAKNDWLGQPVANRTITPAGLTRAALEACVGQGFYPGIEAGIIVMLQDIYASPFDFRFDHAKLEAGDITALMALPWQADFLLCRQEDYRGRATQAWWPSQRPDIIRAKASDTTGQEWARGIGRYEDMVNHVNQLGMAMPSADGQGFMEVGRDEIGLASAVVPVHAAAAAVVTTAGQMLNKSAPRRRRSK